MRIQTLAGLGCLIAAFGGLVAGCSAGEPLDGESVSQTAEALRANGIVDINVEPDYYCGSVNLFNNSGSATSGWTAIVRPPLGGSFDTGWDATFDPPAADGSVMVRSVPQNASIAPMATKTAAFSVCVNRVDAAKFTVTNATATSCPTFYLDSDHDGFGDVTHPISACTQPTDYVSDATDCCDSDARAFPGQTAYYSTPTPCGNYDFNCNTTITKKSNGPTGCYEAPLTCTLSGTDCIASAPPAGCNGEFRSNPPASCGQTWYTNVKGCYAACTQGVCVCNQWNNGGPGGTQLCQ